MFAVIVTQLVTQPNGCVSSELLTINRQQLGEVNLPGLSCLLPVCRVLGHWSERVRSAESCGISVKMLRWP